MGGRAFDSVTSFQAICFYCLLTIVSPALLSAVDLFNRRATTGDNYV